MVPEPVLPSAPPAAVTAPGATKSPAKTGTPRAPKKAAGTTTTSPSRPSKRNTRRTAATTPAAPWKRVTAGGKRRSQHAAGARSRRGAEATEANTRQAVQRAAERRHHARASHRAAVTGSKPKSKPKHGFTITQAAEDVVEVIPGSVLLALVGMMALTLMVMLRSIVTERHSLRRLRATYEATVHALATAVEAKDDTTGGHIERVRDLGLLLAREIVPRDARDPQMAWGFLLHDIGKLSVPDAILRKPGRLDDMEWALMRRHAEEGVRILEGTPFLDRALDVVLHHHERWDGAGYPAGLAGEEIPLWARIFAVVDTLDAITSTRPYRPCQTLDAAIAEIQRCAGSQFDPAVVEALDRLDRDEIEALLEHKEQAESTHAEAVRQEVAV